MIPRTHGVGALPDWVGPRVSDDPAPLREFGTVFMCEPGADDDVPPHRPGSWQIVGPVFLKPGSEIGYMNSSGKRADYLISVEGTALDVMVGETRRRSAAILQQLITSTRCS